MRSAQKQLTLYYYCTCFNSN